MSSHIPRMSSHSPRDPEFEPRTRASFARQPFMALLGASLERVDPGEVEVRLPFRAGLTQQHGFTHAGAIAAIADTACGYAALTLMETGSAVLSIEFKINLVAPAAGTAFIATGTVVRSGRTITVCSGEVRALRDDTDVVVAVMQATMMAVRDRADLAD